MGDQMEIQGYDVQPNQNREMTRIGAPYIQTISRSSGGGAPCGFALISFTYRGFSTKM